MSDPETTRPESAGVSAGAKPPARRISNSRSKKSAKSQKAKKDGRDKAAASSYPVFDLSESPAEQPPVVEEPGIQGDWPEPESASAGEAAAKEGSKRKRRRKKGKGGGQQIALQPATGDAGPLAGSETAAATAPQPRPSPPPQRSKHDPEKIAKLALKIYLAEVSEEGVALIGDNDARELSRRCFKLAEIFIEEETRHR
jgi:hypothetical protein